MSARSLNKVMLIGNLTRDPELRYTPNGSAVCTLGIATNRSYTPSDGGETQEETEFHRLVAWGKLAEICSQLLYKGRKVYFDGRLQTRKWSGQDGQERVTTEIVVENMIALSPPRGAGGDRDDAGGYSGGRPPAGDPSGAPAGDLGASDDLGGSGTSDDKPKPEQKSEVKTEDVAKNKSEEEVDVDDIPF